MKQGKQLIVWIIGIVLASTLVLWPLFRPGFFVSDDGGWMIVRLSAFAQSFREGQFPVRFLGRLNHSYGYPVANFLYPGFLYIGSVIHAAGLSYIDTVKVLLGGSVVLSGVMTFIWLSAQFSLLASFMGALGVVFSPYLAFDLYRRGSVGEVLAIAACMTLLAAIERFPWAVAPLVAFLILSHNTLALLLLGFIVLYLLVQKKTSLFSQVLIGLGLSAFFWIPALVEQRYVWFSRVQVSNPFEYFLSSSTYWLVGVVPLGMMVLSFLLPSHAAVRGRTVFFFLFLVAVVFCFPISTPFWHIGVLAKIVQFPYRMLALTTVCGSWIIAYGVHRMKKRKALLLPLLVALWVLPLTPFLQQIDVQQYPDTYYSTNEATTTVRNEYMPRWVIRPAEERPNAKLEFFTGRGMITYQKQTTQHIKATIHAEEQSVIQVNTVYYPGWGMQLDGQPVVFSYNNPQGVMRVNVPHGDHALSLEFRETPMRFAADMVSLLSLGFFLSWLTFVAWRGKTV